MDLIGRAETRTESGEHQDFEPLPLAFEELPEIRGGKAMHLLLFLFALINYHDANHLSLKHFIPAFRFLFRLLHSRNAHRCLN